MGVGMLRLLAFLWSGCWHKWETIQRVNIYSAENVGQHRRLPTGFRYELRCQNCGIVKGKSV